MLARPALNVARELGLGAPQSDRDHPRLGGEDLQLPPGTTVLCPRAGAGVGVAQGHGL